MHEMLGARNTRAGDLGALIEAHRADIADLWAAKVYEQPELSSPELWTDIIHVSVTQGLQTVIDLLRHDDITLAEPFLTALRSLCLRGGLENSDGTDLLLLGKESILTFIMASDVRREVLRAMIAALDASLRCLIHHFNTLYAADMNRRLREHHQHIDIMLQIGASDPDAVNLDAVLRQIGEGIMMVTEVDHCDFYLVEEGEPVLIPSRGPGSMSIPQAQAFFSEPPDIRTNEYFRTILERKVPLVAHNAPSDQRFDQGVVAAMGATSILSVPLVAVGRVLAVAVTGTFGPYRTFTEEQIELAWDIARAGALVLENARLQQQGRQIAVLEERERLAREIHDNLAQSLSILKLQASNVSDLLVAGRVDQARLFVSQMMDTSTEAHADAREAIRDLRSSASSASDLVPMLRAWLEKFRAANTLDVRLIIQDNIAITLPDPAVIQLTRVIQEALANVRKHAQAHIVWVTLEQAGTDLLATVEDDGVGFDPAQAGMRGGVGLQIMRERMESLGGQLHIDVVVGRGTRIVAQIPLFHRNEGP